jgi:hypothetical protein
MSKEIFLLPPEGPVPNAPYKRVLFIPNNTTIKVYPQQGPRGTKEMRPPFFAKVGDCRYYQTFFTCHLRNMDGSEATRGFNDANTDRDIIVEVDPLKMIVNPKLMFEETILLPPEGPLPTNFASFKRVRYIPNNKTIKVYPQQGPRGTKEMRPPFFAKVGDCRNYGETFLTCYLLKTDGSEATQGFHNADTDSDIIVEVDPVKGESIENPKMVRMTSEDEDELLEQIREEPSYVTAIPPMVWARPTFTEKFVVDKLPVDFFGQFIPDNVKALAAARKLDFASRETGHPLIGQLADKTGMYAPKIENRVLGYLGLPEESKRNAHLYSVLRERSRRNPRGGKRKTKRRSRHHNN